MSQNQVLITIKATDSASTVFKAVTSAVQSLASGIASSASSASANLAKFDAATTKVASGLSTLNEHAQGFAGSELVSFLTEAAHAAGEMESAEARLDTAVENSGKTVQNYGEQLQKATEAGQKLGFAGTDITNALATMTQITGDAQVAFNSLGAAEDLARAKNISLGQAATLISKAYDGQTTALARMGIQLDKTASGEQNVAEISQRFAGSAQAFSGTIEGAFAAAQASAEAFSEKIGGIEAPVARVIALLPGIAQGSEAVSAGATKLATAFDEGGTAATVMGAAISPLGLTIGAVGLAAGVAATAFIHWQQVNADTAQSLADVKEAVDSVFAGQADLTNQFEGFSAKASSAFDTFNVGGNLAERVLNNLTGASEKYFTTQEDANKITEQFAQTLTQIGPGQAATNYAEAVDKLTTALHNQDATVPDVQAVMSGLDAAYRATGPGAAALQSKVDSLDRAFATGQIGPQEYIDDIKALTAYIPAATQALALQQTEYIAAALAGSTWGAMAKGNAQTLPDLTAKTIADAEAQQKLAASFRSALVPAVSDTMAAFKSLQKPGQSVADTLIDIADGARQVGPILSEWKSLATDSFGELVAGLSDTSTALDGVLGTFQALDTLGKRSQDAADIATKLVGDPGTYATVDDLLQRGIITLGQYQAAQAGEVSIVADNARVQDDLNKLRTEEIPLLANAADGYASYVDQLANAGTEQARLALAMQDTATQQKVAQEFSLAYAATLGQIPTQVATDIIVNSAQADPVLAELLQQYKLISIGADGTIDVHLPDGTDVKTGIVAIGHEYDALENTRNGTLNIGGNYTTALPQAKSDLDSIGGTTAAPTVALNDQFSEHAGTIQGDLDRWDHFAGGPRVDVTGDATTKLPEIGDDIDSLPKSVTIPVKVDYSQGGGEAAANDVVGQMAKNAPTQTTTVETKAELDLSDFNASLATAQREGEGFAKQTYAAHLGASRDDFDTALNSAIDLGDSFAKESFSATVSATSDDAAQAISTAEREGEGFAKQTYTATLSAQDNTGDVLVNASSNAHAFANAEYQAQLNASDNASSVIAIPQGHANDFATGEYQAQLNAADNASGVIATPQSHANDFATTYQAILQAVDEASDVIGTVSQELDNLNGKTATTYVQTVYDDTGGPMHAGGGQLGKTVLPRMALGGVVNSRAVLVGEAGPEIALLPFGTQVIPHGASVTRMQQGGTVGPAAQTDLQANPKQAQAAGQTDAVAYFKGLLDQVKQQKQTLHGEIFGNTLFTSADAAKPGLQALNQLGNQHDRLSDKLDDAKRHAKDAGDAGKTAGDKIAAGADEATGAIDGTTQAAGHLASVIGKLQSLRGILGGGAGGGGDTDPIKQAIASFTQQALSGLGQVQGAAQDTGQALDKDIGKGADQAAGQVSNATGQMSSDLNQLPDDAATAGKDAGTAIGKGLSSGIQKSNVSDQINNIQGQLQSLGGTTQGPEISADDKSATQAIQDVGQGVQQLNGDTATINVKVDDAAWQSFKRDVENSNLTATVHSKADKPPKDGGGGKDSGGDSGQLLGGVTRPRSLRSLVPAAALGRMVMVGEAGPELALLPYGTQVMPHGAAQARMRAEGQPAQFVNYGHIHIHPHTADLYQEITAAVAAQQRW